MKFGHLIEYNLRNIFLLKSCRKWGRETSCRVLFIFKKSFICGKSKWFAYQGIRNIRFSENLVCFVFLKHPFWDSPFYLLPTTWITIKANCIKLLHCWSRDMFNFDLLEKSLELVSSPHFVCDFSRKLFLMLYSINWPRFIILLIGCTFGGNEKYVYCNYLFPSLWGCKFWN